MVDLHGLTVCGQLRLRRALGVVALAVACNAEPSERRPAASPPVRSAGPTDGTALPAGPPADLGAMRRPAPVRLVAIGDLHGDLEATRRAFRLARVVDERDRWTGGKTVVVQTGDQLDRGDDEPAILDFLERLAREADASGGAVIVLNGNHEVMNVLGDFRYVTDDGFRDFADGAGADLASAGLAELPERTRGRAAAFAPGSPMAKRLAARSIAAVVGSTAFAHGGVLPEQ
ncbi:MAG TPA: metallophosphoesterase, partial [Nannocystaceae bacterium]|nr:metallophosphoesterase [Nannocystaceae bacterium]